MNYLVNLDEHGILDHAGDRVPIGLLSIAANVGDTKVFDLNHTSRDEFLRQFYQDKPKNVGISVYTSPMYRSAIALAEELKGLTRLIAGGYHATFMPETLTDNFDAVVVGEGETGFKRAFREDGIIISDTEDLNQLNNPNRSLLDMSKYGMNQDGKRTATLITSRGCPYTCSFCGNYDHSVRFEPLNKVVSQMRVIEDEGFDSIYFLDDVFTLDAQRLEDVCGEIKLPYRFTTRANLVDREKFRTLSRSNATRMSIGVESGNDQILRNSRKGMTTTQNLIAVTRAKEVGIKSKGFFIIGLPGETERTARQTINFSRILRDSGMDQADFYYLTPFPGTPVWEDPEKFGLRIIDRDFSHYLQAGQGAKCYVETRELKAGRIEELVREAKEKWIN